MFLKIGSLNKFAAGGAGTFARTTPLKVSLNYLVSFCIVMVNGLNEEHLSDFVSVLFEKI